ncbi:transposase [Novispirillum itersonii]|uniref:Transposase n=1 Tax=Novispirillum itersonii TaxID=189 RepID=A0A7W9ZLM7_NOVIT|nr:transposase [Novispirillum itersonii]
MVLHELINGDWFEAYTRRILVPDLRRDDIVIMENLSSHKRPIVRNVIEAAGTTVLFLPP